MYVSSASLFLFLLLSLSVHPVVRSHLTVSALSALQWLVCSSRRRQSETRSIITLRYYHLDRSRRRYGHCRSPSLHIYWPVQFRAASLNRGCQWWTHSHTCTHLQQKVTLVSGCLYPLLCDGWQLESTPQPHDLHQYIHGWNWFHYSGHANGERVNLFWGRKCEYCRWI